MLHAGVHNSLLRKHAKHHVIDKPLSLTSTARLYYERMPTVLGIGLQTELLHAKLPLLIQYRAAGIKDEPLCKLS